MSVVAASKAHRGGCTDAELEGDFNGLNGFTLGDAIYVAHKWATDSMKCMDGDLNSVGGFSLGDAIFVAEVWTGREEFVWHQV